MCHLLVRLLIYLDHSHGLFHFAQYHVQMLIVGLRVKLESAGQRSLSGRLSHVQTSTELSVAAKLDMNTLIEA